MPGPNNHSTHKKKKQQFLAAISAPTTVVSSATPPEPSSLPTDNSQTSHTHTEPYDISRFPKLTQFSEFDSGLRAAIRGFRSTDIVGAIEGAFQLAFAMGIRASTMEARPALKYLLDQEYEKGRMHGVVDTKEEAQDEHGRGYRDGYAAAERIAEEEYQRGRDTGFEEGRKLFNKIRPYSFTEVQFHRLVDSKIQEGMDSERQSWVDKGHASDDECHANAPAHKDASVATADLPVSVPTVVDDDVQDHSPPSSTPIPPSLPPERVDWASECEAIPIHFAPPTSQLPPRDLSSLCSLSPSNPFKSTQHRASRRRRQDQRHPLHRIWPSQTSRRLSYVIPQRRFHRAEPHTTDTKIEASPMQSPPVPFPPSLPPPLHPSSTPPLDLDPRIIDLARGLQSILCLIFRPVPS